MATFFPATVLAAPMRVVVSILPQKFFVEQLAGELVDVAVMVPPGADPHTYEPRPSQMEALADAHVYFTIGIPFEKVWLPRLGQVNKNLQFVASDRGIEKISVNGNAAAFDRQPVNKHQHLLPDPHIWLDPSLVKQLSRTMTETLCVLDADHQDVYRNNLAQWEERLTLLDEELRLLTAPMQSNPYFLVFHPSWGYFARAYGLQQLAVERHGSEPGPRYLAQLVEQSRKLGIKAIFVQPQYRGNGAALLAGELGGRVIEVDPLAENWLVNLQKVAWHLRQGN
ncbi:MAG: zinc ABC transporter substrate-binding protein [Deltaproteobacteria bacterium]|nr:zinc ABC transporter substrate-binding protein [Candidatus Anaeroferrophillus wilburensis]MBN2888316.1 zinc ABC transporter substrate-binding protein [Deltaproteobacteria bacterium]